MAPDRRVEVRFDPQEFDRLRGWAKARGLSMAGLIRDAVRRQVLEPDARARREAVDLITSGRLGLPPLPDWRGIEDELARESKRDLEAH